MAKKHDQRRQPEPQDDPEQTGERWRGLMTALQENTASLVWRRVIKRFKLDLADPKQASALQVFRLLQAIMEFGDVPLTARMLREHIDDRMETVFGRL